MPLPSINQSSNPGGFSDNFKQKASSLKDKFSPQKLLGGLFGNSKTGDSKLGADAAGRKNPQRTSISSGSNARLKTGDSLADIMAKQLIFMQKTYEADSERYEIENAYRQEQMEEDARRHRKLIEGLKSVKTPTAIPEKQKEKEQKQESDGTPSWLSKMLNGIKSAIFAPFKIILGVVSSVLGAVGSLVMGLGGIIMSVIEGSVGALMKILNSPVTKIITDIVLGLLGTLFKQLFKGLRGLGGVLATLTAPMAAALAAIGIGVAAIGTADYVQSQQLQKKALHEGKGVQDADAELDEILHHFEEKYVRDMQEIKQGSGNMYEKNELLASLKNKYIRDRAVHMGARANKLHEREQQILTPAMAAIGFTPKKPKGKENDPTYDFERMPDGRLKYFDKSGKEASNEDYIRALEPPKVNEGSMLEKMNKGLEGLNEKFISPLASGLKGLESDAKVRIDNIGKDIKDLRSDFQKGYDEEMESLNSINSETNNVNGSVTLLSANPMAVRHRHVAIQKVQYTGSVSV